MINQLKQKWTMLLKVSVIILTISFSVTLWAGDHDNARELMESGDIVPLENILEQLQKRIAGRVIEVELEQKNDRLVYEIEQIDNKGIVREFVFDATDGHLLKEKIDE
ncbi:PepSY domain-containing protein [Alkalimarinus coralli]|uniref:PepSY domain-containing protein n=1 Tax=Alkalimarinus coralli TaxID=2935863 RepID=UPI00202B9870|nr:PepSY domain-containing protein [Alkalimarinus coralli]